MVPLDGSPFAARALTPARSLAERVGASLLLLTTRWDHEVDEAREYLDEQAGELRFDRTETVIVHDRLAPEAILVEARDPHTVVCMSTHGRSGLGHAMLGSVAEAVLRGSDRPVLLVGPSLERGAWQSARWFADGNLLVALDGSKASEAIVPAAAEWARLLGLRACVAQVVPTPIGLVPKPPEHAAGSESMRDVAEALPEVGGSPESAVLHGPDAATSLLDYASQLPATLVAMATHGHTGLARVALGSVAMRVVHRNPCPVLVIRSPHLPG